MVKGIDAVSRERIAGLVAQQGLQAARIPLLLPGAIVPIPLSPPITLEDRAVRPQTFFELLVASHLGDVDSQVWAT